MYIMYNVDYTCYLIIVKYLQIFAQCQMGGPTIWLPDFRISGPKFFGEFLNFKFTKIIFTIFLHNFWHHFGDFGACRPP